MTNTVVHITLPRTLKLKDGSMLGEDMTFDVISRLDPYYASVDQVKLSGGMYVRKLPDVTVACQVYQSSQEADLVARYPAPIPEQGDTYRRFIGSRNQYVQAMAARDLINAVIGLYGSPGSHTLANFSVTRNRGVEGETVAAKIRELNDSVKFYEIVLRSGGSIAPGGNPKYGFAAKGVMDWTEQTPARTWRNTGLGANATSLDFGSPTGGRGKPTKFFNQPFYSPPIVTLRQGIFQGAYPLVVVNPYPNSI